MSGRDEPFTLKTFLVISLIIYLGSISILAFNLRDLQDAIQRESMRIKELSDQLSRIRSEISNLRTQNLSFQLTYPFSEVYDMVKDSVVVIRGKVVRQTIFGSEYGEVQGSGFIYSYNGKLIVITNNHVVERASDITISLLSGETYPAYIIGRDPYSDLAILSTDAPASKLKPLKIASSSTLKIGQPVIAIGSPFGLAGSITTGVISQLGRSISESATGGYPIADVIQISTPINPGNSGGPLLNLRGEVVGVTTAIIAGAQGVGFAIPSDTILRELPYLIEGKSYPHPWLGIRGVDMNYDIAKIMNVNVTYGLLVVEVIPESPAEKAGLRGGNRAVIVNDLRIKVGGDIIVMINGTRIRNGDDLSTYLERNTKPGDKIQIAVIRAGRPVNVTLELGVRPPPG